MWKGFLIDEEMRKYFPMYEEAVSHIHMTLQLLPFWISLYMRNFFISVRTIKVKYGVRSPRLTWASCAQLYRYSSDETPQRPPPHGLIIRARYWSAKIDDGDVSLWWSPGTDCTAVSTCPCVSYMCVWSAVAKKPLQYYTRSLFGGPYLHN